MVFSSILFLVYFLPIFFGVYYILPNKWKNGWLLLSSVLFYWWGVPTFFFIFIGSCLLDYYFIRYYIKKEQLVYYYITIVGNIALLFYFKYFNFFIENISSLVGVNISWVKIALPIGISFVTFQKISYLVDVKRKNCEPQSNFHFYLLYIILFPQLIAGPIVRYKEIEYQISNRFKHITSTNIYLGLRRFIIGLSKKVIIANVLSVIADQVFAIPHQEVNISALILGLLAYTFQLYFDFSGYSDMAIGLGKMMGFTFPENFNFPYISKSITEFWRRWHITLGNWMKDYLYLPLGGNRKGKVRTYFNLFTVFLLTGLWHGASWNFLIWGMYNGVFLVLERLFLLKFLNRLPALLSTIYSFFFVVYGLLWVRTDSFTGIINYHQNAIKNGFSLLEYQNIFTSKFYFTLLIAILFSFSGIFAEEQLNKVNTTLGKYKWNLWFSHLMIIILSVLCLGELLASGFNPFIYFKF